MNKNRWKRLLSLMLALTMILSWNVPTYAAEPEQESQERTTCSDGEHQMPEVGTEGLVVTPGTCMTPEKWSGTCAKAECGAEVTDQVVKDAEGNPKLDPENHEWGDAVRIPPNCKNNAMEVQKCKNPKHLEEDKAEVINEETKKDLWEDVPEADRKPEDQAGGHDYSILKKTMKAATCAKAGVGTYECTGCGSQTTKVIPAAHAYPEEPTKTINATCQKAGEKQYTCTRYQEGEGNTCDKVEGRVKTETIDKLDHKPKKDEQSSHEATCGEGGVTNYICELCGMPLQELTQTIPATGNHDYKDNTIIPSTECGVAPKIGRVCSACNAPETEEPVDMSEEMIKNLLNGGEKIEVDGKVVYYADHKWGEAKGDPSATCTQDGVLVKNCENCGKEDRKTDPAGHKNFVQEGDKIKYTKQIADCTLGGYYTKECADCHAEVRVTEAEEIEAAGGAEAIAPKQHDIVEVEAKEPTCTTPGNTDGKQCSVCKIFTEGSTIPVVAANHVLGEDKKVIREATCDVPGMQSGTCTECKKSVYMVIPAAHDWADGTVTKEATCTDKGEMSTACKKCGLVNPTAEIPALGHNYNENEGAQPVEGESKEATCITDGKKVVKCTRYDKCEGIQTTILKAKGHNFDTTNGATKIEAECKAATCGTVGKEVIKCADCEVKQTTPLPMTGEHQNATVELIDANCQHGTRIGLKCSVCGQAVAKEGAEEGAQPIFMEFPKETTLAEVIQFYKDNKDVTGYTLLEGEGKVNDAAIKVNYDAWIKKAGPAVNHDWIETIKEAAKCGVAGKMDRVCSFCSKKDPDVEIPARTHLWVLSDAENAVTLPKCDGTPGYELYECGYEDCDGSEKREMDLDGYIPEHEEEEAQTIREATCTQNGLIKHACKNCTWTEMEIIPGEHKWGEPAYTGEVPAPGEGEEPAVLAEPTCTKAGVGLVTCARGENCPIKTQVQSVPAKGHTWGKTDLMESTCTAPAMVGKTCAIEGCDGVDIENAQVITAESNVNELLTLILADLDTVNAEVTAQKRTALENAKKTPGAKGHTYGTEENIAAGAKPDESKSVEATCRAKGKDVYVCGNGCGEDMEIETPTIAHTEKEVYIPATCMASGKIQTVCAVCDKELSAPQDMEGDPILPHDFQRTETVISGGKDICTNGGTYVQICKNAACNHLKETGNIDPGHDLVAKQESVTEEGKTKVVVILEVCKRADTCKKAPEVKWAADGYSYCSTCQRAVKVTVEKGTPATCTTAGTQDKLTCATCDGVIQEAENTEPLGHDTIDEGTDWITVKEPTCKTKGVKVRYCSKCYEPGEDGQPGTGEILEEDEIKVDSTKHKWEDNIQPATCQHEERYAEYCTECGIVKEGSITVITPGVGEHAYGTEKDKADYGKCTNPKDDGTVCGAAAPDGLDYCTKHGWSSVKTLPAQEADCENDGWEERVVCSHFDDKDAETKCDTVYSGEKTTDKLGHQTKEEVTNWTTKENATCGTAGTEEKLCRCGKVLDTRTIPAAGKHDYGWVTESVTCHTPEKEVYKCKVCNDKNHGLGDAYADITHGTADPALHKFDGDGNCTNEGCSMTLTNLKTEQKWSCREHESADITVIPGTEATCIKQGKTQGYQCAGSECETIFLAQKTIPVSDHKFGDDGICEVCKTKNITVSTSAFGQVVDGNDKLTLRANIQVADRDKVVEMGILYITKSGYTGTVEDAKADLTVLESEMHDNTFTLAGREFARAKQYNINENANLGNYTQASVNFNFGAGTNRSRQVYARGYVIMENADGGYEIHYAEEILTGTVGSFF